MLCLKGLCPKKTKVMPLHSPHKNYRRNKCQSPFPKSIKYIDRNKRTSPIQIPMNLRHQELLGVSKSPPSKVRSDLRRYEDGKDFIKERAPYGRKEDVFLIQSPDDIESTSIYLSRDDCENIIFPPI